MKQELTLKQSQHLIDLGINTNNTSKLHSVSSIKEGPINVPIFTFTIGDLLEILPKDITIDDEEYYIICSACYPDGSWGAYYAPKWNPEAEDIGQCRCVELIDTLYELVMWCIENGRIDVKQLLK